MIEMGNSIVNKLIEEKHKQYYYRGLKEFEWVPGYLLDICLSAPDTFKQLIGYFYPER